MTTTAAILKLLDIRRFLLAGHAKFTLVSKKTGDRRTFRVERKGEENFWFVSMLVGPNNGEDYRYLCCMFEAGGGLKLKQNKEKWATDAFSAFLWMTGHINAIGAAAYRENWFFDQCEFWHAGECGRCGRELTDPESIARGLGPICAERS